MFSTFKNLSICRTCLSSKRVMNCIFSTERFQERDLRICDLIALHTSVQILEGDGLPSKVCIECVEKLKRIHEFKKLCEDSDGTLRNCLNGGLDLYSKELNDLIVGSQGKNRSIVLEEIAVTSKQDDDEAIVKDLDERIPLASVISSFHNYAKTELPDELNVEVEKQQIEVEDENVPSTAEVKGRRYKCLKCNIVFSAQAHACYTRAKQKFSNCKRCNESFSTKSQHRMHNCITQAANAPKTRPRGKLSCKICKLVTYNMQYHMRRHTGEKPYMCSECGKCFSKKQHLEVHSRIHSCERPYKCDTCGRACRTAGNLAVHVKRHIGDKPFVCHICGKRYVLNRELKQHIEGHSKERLKECSFCRNPVRGSMKLHVRMHSGERPFKCEECGKGFASKKGLVRHFKGHSKDGDLGCGTL